MAGPTYAASVTLAVTALHSLASDQTLVTGWTSASTSNTTNNYLDYLISGTFTTHATARQAGYINVYAYSSLNGTPAWPDIFITGTEGTEGAAAMHDAEERDSALRLVTSILVDNSPSAIYTFPQLSLKAAFDLMELPPSHFAIFVTQNCSTTTAAGLAAAGSAIYLTPVVSP